MRHRHPGWQTEHTLPVVDRNGVLVGTFGHQMLHELEGGPAPLVAEAPLGLAVGEMYWGVLSAVLESIGKVLNTGDAPSEAEERR